MKKIIVIDIIILLFLVPSIIFTKVYYYVKDKNINLSNFDIVYENKIDEDFKYTVKIDSKENNELYSFKIDNSDYLKHDNAVFKLEEGKHILYVKKGEKIASKEVFVKKNILGSFSSSIDNLDIYYLALNGQKAFNFSFKYDDTFNKNVYYKIENSNVIKIENNIVYGLSVGNSKVTAYLEDGNKKEYNFMVTDLIVPMHIDNNKPYLSCNKYTFEEAQLLDDILYSRVKEGIAGSRGGVLAAARFLTLEFPYSINYFNENGRLNNHNSKHIDGEGRYYHKGLYLDSSKYLDIEKNSSTFSGPKIWGCPLYDEYLNSYRSNGFSCSGFVTWAMYNGGFDVKDVGAGDYIDIDDELSDLGKRNKITYEYMKNGNYKVGDFIARDGHAALIIGIDENNIYTAESLPPKLKVYTYERYSGIVKDTNLTYIIEMDDIYKEKSSNYNNMW